MTHEELLIELKRRLEIALYNGDPQSIHALLAVVKLHKPNEFDYCAICVMHTEVGPMVQSYPCQTIRVIEKELE